MPDKDPRCKDCSFNGKYPTMICKMNKFCGQVIVAKVKKGK